MTIKTTEQIRLDRLEDFLIFFFQFGSIFHLPYCDAFPNITGVECQCGMNEQLENLQKIYDEIRKERKEIK